MKKSIIGFFAIVLAIGFSAFKNAPEKKVVVPGASITAAHLIQVNPGGFAQFSGTTSSLNCFNVQERFCSYNVTEDGQANIPDQTSYTTSEIDTYVTNGWLVQDPIASLALYNL